MTLLLTIFAAIIATVCWYRSSEDKMQLSFLSLMFWGASLMWLVDAVFAYIEEGAASFAPSAEEMLNDAYLGFSVIALGLIIWLVRLLLADPQGKLRAALQKKA
ncbi:MAG: hypothetical protein MSC43_00640 [Clostridiales bacterium]|nr:hypothetical protein [Clostridiales bacterium]MDD7432430.1 hypothetical protein [Clostridiales bacterium]MDY3061864.1 hypothetical protein [Eubacteriales bacterium]